MIYIPFLMQNELINMFVVQYSISLDNIVILLNLYITGDNYK